MSDRAKIKFIDENTFGYKLFIGQLGSPDRTPDTQ